MKAIYMLYIFSSLCNLPHNSYRSKKGSCCSTVVMCTAVTCKILYFCQSVYTYAKTPISTSVYHHEIKTHLYMYVESSDIQIKGCVSTHPHFTFTFMYINIYLVIIRKEPLLLLIMVKKIACVVTTPRSKTMLDHSSY